MRSVDSMLAIVEQEQQVLVAHSDDHGWERVCQIESPALGRQPTPRHETRFPTAARLASWTSVLLSRDQLFGHFEGHGGLADGGRV
jgi:hypothetical protein